ncbi:MAG: CRISPR-associated protein Cas2 [Chthoniobacteraceae bacterium]|nr:CRISPR-associated protein Cas2 [Chthoniobacteraceae bacterium]MDB6175091.1 CRISPR-associated protein Cas2 [Chthoniobacteraceae bacterium]
MRTSYIVTYDICDPKRLRKAFHTCKAYGTHLQLSVFECDLSEAEFVKLKRELEEVIKHDEDQILFVALGATETRGKRLIESIGIPYTKMDAACYVV